MKTHIIGKKDLGLFETLQSAFETAHNPGKAFGLLRLTLSPCELLGRFSLGVRADLLCIGGLRRAGCSIAVIVAISFSVRKTLVTPGITIRIIEIVEQSGMQ